MGPGSRPPAVNGRTAQPQPPTPVYSPGNPPTQQDHAQNFPMGRQALIERMPVKMRQQYLNSHGYNVTVDGKPGVQTHMAAKAFVKGIPASYWNKVWMQNHPKPAPGTAIGAGPPPPSAATTAAVTPGVPPGATAVNPNPISSMITVPGLGRVSLVNPGSFATAEMNAKYGPQQAALAQAMAQAEADQKGHQTDIENWYNAILGQQAAGGKANIAALKGILGGADASNLGLVNALGGSANTASSNVASLGQIGRNDLEQTAANQANFDDTQHSAIGRQGVDVANQEYAKGEQTKKDLVSQIAAMQAQRGSDYDAALSQAQQTRVQQQIAVHDARVSDAMLPGQLQGQALDNAGKSSSIALNNAKIDQFNQANSTTQDWTKPQTQNDWNDAVTQTVTAKDGTLLTSPLATWTQIQHQLARNGLSSNPTAVRIAKQAVQDALSKSHARGMFTRWVWGPKGLVQTKAKTKKG